MTAPKPTAEVARACRYLHARALSFDNDANHLTRPAVVGEVPRPKDADERAKVARIVACELRDAADDLERGPM